MPRTLASTRTAATTRTAVSSRTAMQSPLGLVSGTLLDDFESGFSKLSGSAGSTVAHAAEFVKTGTNSLKCFCDSAGTNLFAQKTGLSLSFNTTATWVLWVYVESPYGDTYPSGTMTFSLFFSKDGFGTSVSTTSPVLSLQKGWNRVAFGRGDWTLNGATTWQDTYTAMRVKVTAIAGQNLTMHFDSLYTNESGRPILMLDFDDGDDAQYTTFYPYMSARGFRGSMYLNSDNIAGAGFMTLAQIQEMHAAGWACSNHCKDHTDMTTQSQAVNESSLSTCQAYLIANNLTNNEGWKHMAYPFGRYNTAAIAAVTAQGFQSARATYGRPTSTTYLDNQYLVSSYSVTGKSMNSLAALNAPVLRWSAARSILRYVFHDASAGAPAVDRDIQTSVFQSFIDWCVLHQAEFDILTVTDVYAMSQGSRRPAQ